MSHPAPIVIPIRADTKPLEEDITNAGEKAGAEAGKKTAAAISKNLGAGLAVGGAGLEKFARSAQSTTLQLTRVATSTGLPVKGLRDLAASTSNAGFETQEVIDTFEALSKQGVTTKSDLARVANVWDEVADATGGNAAELAKAATSLGAFGISAKNPEKALDALGTVAFHTKGGIQGFTAFIQKQGPTIAGYGISLNDTAAAMVALGRHGLDGKKGQVAFTAALKANNGNLKDALKSLGISGTEFAKFQKSVKGGADELKKSGDAADNVLTPMQKLHAGFQALVLRSGQFGVIAGQLAPILIGVGSGLAGASKAAQFFDTGIGKKLVGSLKKFGTALKFSNLQTIISTIKTKVMAVVTKAWAAAQKILNVVMEANPMAKVALLLIALAAAFIIAYKKSATFRDFVQAAFKVIKEVVGDVADFITKTVPAAFQKMIDGVKAAWTAVVNFFTAIPKEIASFFSAAATWLLNAGKWIINGLWTGIKFYWTLLWTWYVLIPIKIIKFFAGALAWLLNAGKNIVLGLWNGLRAVWANVASWFAGLFARVVSHFTAALTWLLNAGKDILTGLWNGLKAVWTTVIGWFGGLGAAIDGVFATAGTWLLNIGKSIITGLWNGLKAVWTTAYGFLTGLGGKIVGAFKGAGKWLYNTGKDILNGLWNGLKGAASSAGNFVADIGKDIVNFIISGLDSILNLPWTIHIPLPVVPDIGPFTILPKIPLLREGGLITGPGTGTSDSIDAKVSTGEYVVNAKATKEWLPLLEAINWGKGGVASGNGGPSAGQRPNGTPSVVAPEVASGATVINQNYYGPTTSAARKRELVWTQKYGTF